MSESGFALFETPIGSCGIAWGPGGICGLQLPEANDRAAMARLRRRFPALAPAEPPPAVTAAMARITAFQRGGAESAESRRGKSGSTSASLRVLCAFALKGCHFRTPNYAESLAVVQRR